MNNQIEQMLEENRAKRKELEAEVQRLKTAETGFLMILGKGQKPIHLEVKQIFDETSGEIRASEVHQKIEELMGVTNKGSVTAAIHKLKQDRYIRVTKSVGRGTTYQKIQEEKVEVKPSKKKTQTITA